MTPKIYNQCKLCLKNRELKHSHIYPKWAVKNLRDEETSRFATIPKSNAQDGPKASNSLPYEWKRIKLPIEDELILR